MDEDKSAPLADIDLVASEIDRKDANLLLPVTAYAEILRAKHTQDQMDKFSAFVTRSNVIPADITLRISLLVEEIRSNGLKAKPKRSIKTPDGQFMATALLYKADVFHTLEPALQNLDGSSIVKGLRISAPKPLDGQASVLNPTGPEKLSSRPLDRSCLP
jgi:hypothetical protein